MLLGNTNSDFPLNWAVLFPVITGFLAVWYLLPTPRPRSLVHGTLGVLAAIAGLGTFLFAGLGGDWPFNPEVILFYAFSLMAFTFGILMIVQRNPARSALFFSVVVLSVCGLFLLLAAPFLMAATIIIYAGAIIVTFLFVIMLSHQGGFSDANDRSREPSLAAAVGFLLLGTMLVVLQRVYWTREADDLIKQCDHLANATALDDSLREQGRARLFVADVRRVREKLGHGKLDIPTHVDGKQRREIDSDPVGDLEEALNLNPPTWPSTSGQEMPISLEEVKSAARQIHFELTYLKAVREGRISPAAEVVELSPYGQSKTVAASADPAKAEIKRLPNANIAALGRVLFTDHLIAIELGGTLLLVATIGAIAIVGSRPEKTV